MKAAVVYESMHGNTHHVATAIGDGLRSVADVVVVPVNQVETSLIAVDLLIVGGPTHVHGMSRASTRTAEAAEKPGNDVELEPDAEGPGLREWFAGLDSLSTDAVAFDTRMHGPAEEQRARAWGEEIGRAFSSPRPTTARRRITS